jgi:hypothetical protein
VAKQEGHTYSNIRSVESNKALDDNWVREFLDFDDLAMHKAARYLGSRQHNDVGMT